MKAILLICLLVCLTCNDATDVGKCFVKIPQFKVHVIKLLDIIKTKNVKKISEAVEVTTSIIEDDAMACINKVNSFKGLTCKYPTENLKCLVQCGFPDEAPRYTICYNHCRERNCL